MSFKEHFDPLEAFAEIERLMGKVYFRFSHLFFHHTALRDFWWQMAMDEEQHSATLLACKEILKSLPEEKKRLDSSISPEKADQFKRMIHAYLIRGTPSISMEGAFKIALELETSELSVIFGKLIRLGGVQEAETLVKAHRERLSSAIDRFIADPELQAAARGL